MFVKIKTFIKEVQLPFLLDLFRWLLIDIYRRIRYSKPLHLYGIVGIVGLYGGGKTMTLVEYLERMRRKHGDKLYIATNFFYRGQDFPITHWRDLLKKYDRPVIFGYDELQNEFNSRDYKNFPISLMWLLTQNRKGHGKTIVYTAQDYETVDKNFRRLTRRIWACKTHFGRWTSVKKYDREDFEQLQAAVDVQRKMKIKPVAIHSFVQSDFLRDCYDSYQMLDSAVKKDYVSRDELTV